MSLRQIILFFIIIAFICNCKKSSTKSDDEDTVDSAFIGSWGLIESSENGAAFDESIAASNIIFTFQNGTIAIDWGGMQTFTGVFSTDENENPKKLDIELDEATPWHHNPVLCIYKFDNTYTLIIKINDGIETRAQNFNMNINYDIYRLSKFLDWLVVWNK